MVDGVEMKKKELKRRLDWADEQVTIAHNDAYERGREAEEYKTAYESKCHEFDCIMRLKNNEIEKGDIRNKNIYSKLIEADKTISELLSKLEQAGIE